MNEANVQEVITQCLDEIKNRIASLRKLNLMVVGKTGVGKSTLINTVFKENFAATGVGKPVTSEIRKYTKENYPLTLYDTPGFELSDQQRETVNKGIQSIINDGINSGDISEAIHCIWYCINPNIPRIDPEEIKWLRSLSDQNITQQVPVIVVLTQAFSKDKAQSMRREINKLNLNIVNVVPVLAKNQAIDEDYTAKSYGLENLIKIMFDVLPEKLKETLNNIQVVSLETKISQSRKAVLTAVSAATVASASPIPFSDAFVLVPIQITMIASITCIFGINLSKGILTSLITSAIGTTATTMLGRQIVVGLLKLIPGIGTGAGGVISATTAATLTTALGEAYIQLMKMLYDGKISKEDLELEKGKQLFIEKFKEQTKSIARIN